MAEKTPEDNSGASEQQIISIDGDSQDIQGAPTKLSEAGKKEVLDLFKDELKKAGDDFLKTAKTNAAEEIRKQVQTDKASLITVFGIFASIISFLTIEFQFLRTICSFEKLIGFTLILSSLLLCFNLALDYLVKSRTDEKTPKPNTTFGIFLVLLLVGGICYTALGNEEKCKDIKIYEKYSEEFKNQQIEFNQKYKEEQNEKYAELMTRIENVEKYSEK